MVATKANPFRIAHVLTPTPGPATRIEAVSWDASQAGPKPGCFINNPSISRRPGSQTRRAGAALGGQGGLRGVGVIKADNQAGVLAAVEGDLQPAGLAAVHRGEQQLAHGPVEEGPVREPARPVPTPNLEVARLQPLDPADRPVDDVNALYRRERDADVAMHRHDALAGGQPEDDLVAVAHNVRHGQPPDSGG